MQYRWVGVECVIGKLGKKKKKYLLCFATEAILVFLG